MHVSHTNDLHTLQMEKLPGKETQTIDYMAGTTLGERRVI